VLALAKRLKRVPYIVIDNNECEYWTRSASLVHTDLGGHRDAPLHPRVRLYAVDGAPHRGAAARDGGVAEHGLSTIDVAPFLRAVLVLTDEWASRGIEPPPSLYPRIARKELIPVSLHKARFPAIPGARHPGRNLSPPRVDYGPRFWSEGVMTFVPPRLGRPYRTLVPSFDADGNGTGGVRLPDIAVPLGTYQGWNPRRAEFGAPEFLTRFDDSFWPFCTTEDERRAKRDPRRSIESRYRDKDDYVRQVAEACRRLVEERLLLEQDAREYVRSAADLLWPPAPQREYPFWRVLEREQAR
jgi:hypothetical protein